MASVEERVTKLETKGEQFEKDKTALFDLHNGLVVPALGQMERTTQNIKETSKILSDLSKRVDGIHDKQVACQAAKEAEAKLNTRGTNTLQKVSIWAGILTFIASAMIGAATGIYKFVTLMIEQAK